MKKILFANAILGTTILGLIGCAPAATDANRTVVKVNANTAAIVNANSNAAAATTNSNLSSNQSSSSKASPETPKTVSDGDREFMDEAMQGGMTEVQMGNAAILKSDNEAVKAFGQKMITDHSKANRQLTELAKDKNVMLAATMSLEQTQTLGNLSQLSGAAFDREYVKLMVEDHEKDVAEFQKQADGGTDPQLKRFAVEALPNLKMHLQMVRELKAKIK